MTDAEKTDPLVGFHVTDYDEATETVTIQIHRLVVKHSTQALAEKLVEIEQYWPNVKSVVIEFRPGT